VVFTCNSCPVATDYEDRILAFSKKYAGPDGKVGLVAINVNRLPEDRLPKMRERAAARGFDFPYLYDETQKIGRQFGAASSSCSIPTAKWFTWAGWTTAAIRKR